MISRSLPAIPPVAGLASVPGGPCADVDVARVAGEVRSDVEAATDRLDELERLQALVVSTTAHELRTPLTVLRVHADLLIERGGAVDADERESLEAIRGAVERLQAVSDHLITELRETAGGAEGALRRWLRVDDGAQRTPTRPS